MASAQFLVISCIRDSTSALWVCSTLSELSVGLYPKRIWLGESPVVTLIRLLCTMVASASQCIHPFGSFNVTNRRYCSIHWFFRSDSPSVYVVQVQLRNAWACDGVQTWEEDGCA